MKLIKNILALPFALFSLSSSTPNASIITLTSFEVEYDQANNKIALRPRISVSQDSTSVDCYFIWNVYIDGSSEMIKISRLLNFKKCTNKYLEDYPTYNISSLGTENYVEIEIRPSDTPKVYQKKKLYLNNKGNTRVTFNESNNNVGVSSGFHIESYSPFDKDKNYILEDRVIFYNYEDLVVEEVYSSFDISRFEFNYVGNKSKSSLEGNFYFALYDKYNIFTDLPLFKESQYRYIPLKVVKIDNGHSVFAFKNNIYYNPETHYPSFEYKENYLPTNKLYFPFEHVDKLKNNHCMLSFDINGYTSFNMSSEFDIRFIKNYFGDCEDSEYCVQSSSDEGDNVREKEVEIPL